MAVSQETNATFEPMELLEGFQSGLLMRQRIDLLGLQITDGEQEIFGTIHLDKVGGRELYRADVTEVDGACCGRLYGLRAEQRKIRCDMGELQARLSTMAARAAVTILPLQPDSTAIQRTSWVSPPTARSYEEVVDKHVPKAEGTICSINLMRNELRVQPQRFSKANINSGEYVIYPVDSKGYRSVSIIPRKAGVRDIQAPTIMQRLAKLIAE